MIAEIPNPPALAPDVIQVWKADLLAWKTSAEYLAGLLSTPERDRLARLKIQTKRIEFNLSRGLLRLILGSCLGQDPRKLDIHLSQQGKPYLPDQDVRFNISHSGNLLLCACGLNRNIGIDIQQIYHISSLDTIIKRNFSTHERIYLEGLDSSQDAFFDIWTAKEAYLKGLGAGFQRSPIEVSLLPDPRHPGRFTVSKDSANFQPWSVISLPVGEGFKAALAVEGEVKETLVIPLLPPGIAGDEGFPAS